MPGPSRKSSLECVAVILKSEGESYSSLSYEQLAQLHNAALKGNPAARIALEKMPAGERRLASMLYKAYTPDKPRKGKKSKRDKVITKAQKANVDARLMRLQLLLGHPDPFIRETARTRLESGDI